jgi:hypothetical protein
MHITYTQADYHEYLRAAEKSMKASDAPVIGLLNSKLSTPFFHIRIYDSTVSVTPADGFEGPPLIAPLESFLNYCHNCNKWEFDLSAIKYVEGAKDSPYLEAWLDAIPDKKPDSEIKAEFVRSLLRALMSYPPSGQSEEGGTLTDRDVIVKMFSL